MAAANFHRWDDVPQFEVTPQIGRRAISGEKAMVTQFHLAKGAVVAQHNHPHEQILIIVSGVIEFESAGDERILRPGDVVHVPSNVPHGGTMMEDTVTYEIFSPPRQEFLTD